MFPKSDDVLDTLSCVFKMKKDCDEHIGEAYDFIGMMNEWFKDQVGEDNPKDSRHKIMKQLGMYVKYGEGKRKRAM